MSETIFFIAGFALPFLLDLLRHATYFINWNYWQKRVWIRRHWRTAYDIELEDEIVREMAYRACGGPEICECQVKHTCGI